MSADKKPDLSDDELSARLKRAMGERHLEPFVEPLRELQRHRAAQAASSAEHVRGIVVRAINDLSTMGVVARNRIADCVAAQLTATGPALTADERELLKHLSKDINRTAYFGGIGSRAPRYLNLLDKLIGEPGWELRFPSAAEISARDPVDEQ